MLWGQDIFLSCSLIYLKIWAKGLNIFESLLLYLVPGIDRVLRKYWSNDINNILMYSQKDFFFLFTWWVHWNKRKLTIDFLSSESHRIELHWRIMEFYLSSCNYLLEKDPREQNSFPLWLFLIVWKRLLPETHWIKIWTAQDLSQLSASSLFKLVKCLP